MLKTIFLYKNWRNDLYLQEPCYIPAILKHRQKHCIPMIWEASPKHNGYSSHYIYQSWQAENQFHPSKVRDTEPQPAGHSHTDPRSAWRTAQRQQNIYKKFPCIGKLILYYIQKIVVIIQYKQWNEKIISWETSAPTWYSFLKLITRPNLRYLIILTAFTPKYRKSGT